MDQRDLGKILINKLKKAGVTVDDRRCKAEIARTLHAQTVGVNRWLSERGAASVLRPVTAGAFLMGSSLWPPERFEERKRVWRAEVMGRVNPSVGDGFDV